MVLYVFTYVFMYITHCAHTLFFKLHKLLSCSLYLSLSSGANVPMLNSQGTLTTMYSVQHRSKPLDETIDTNWLENRYEQLYKTWTLLPLGCATLIHDHGYFCCPTSGGDFGVSPFSLTNLSRHRKWNVNI